jgi:hypothetical protein
MSKQKVFTGMIRTDGVSICAQYPRLRTDRPIVSLISPSAKREENNHGDPVTQEVQENDFVVGADPGNTNIVTIAVPKSAEDGIDGILRQKNMHLLKFSIARYYRESRIMKARKQNEK